MADGLEKLIEPSEERSTNQAVYSHRHGSEQRKTAVRNTNRKAQHSIRDDKNDEHQGRHHYAGRNSQPLPQDDNLPTSRRYNENQGGPDGQRQGPSRGCTRNQGPWRYARNSPQNQRFEPRPPPGRRFRPGPPSNQRHDQRSPNQRYRPRDPHRIPSQSEN